MRGQALARLLLVGLFVAIVITMVASNNYYTQREREVAQKRASIQQLYEKELPREEERWQDEAEQIKARIEFSRILEEKNEARWPKFNAFLNAQSEFTRFANLLIVRGEDQIIFSYGPVAHKIQSTPTLFTAAWHYAEEPRELYRVYRLPIWLGEEGQGMLLLLKTVDNAAMSAMAAPETRLYLYFHDQILATSTGDIHETIRPGMKQAYTPNRLQLVQADLDWPGGGVQPTLIVQRELHLAYPLKEFLLRPIAVILIITSLIWLGLGRWLTRTVRRIENLETATNNYAKIGLAVLASEQLQAAGRQPDEITDLANAMDKLMHEIESRNLEQKAYLDTLSMLEEAVLELSCDGVILRASPGWSKLSHCSDAIGKSLYDFIHREDREVLRSQCKILSSGEKHYALLRLRLHVEGSLHAPWLECRFVCFHDEAGKMAGVRGVLRDITQAYLNEKQITHMALHDALTGLPNRVLLEDRIKISLRQASRTQQKVGICFIDLDHFKNVNDTLGHKSGDKLLLAFAERLRRQLREGDTVARWGGDEFVLLLPDMDSEQDIRDVTMKVSEEVQIPLQLEDTDMLVTFSMGVALYPNDGEDIETLFSQADRTMFFAKAQGRNQTCFFRDMTAKGIGKKELYIQNRLATAINTQKVQAWFQPIIAANSGCCIGVEVLARWHDDEQGWISPATFIPMAENLGLIHELGQQVLLGSLAAAKRWRESGMNLTLAINISKRQLFTPYFTERLRDEVAKHQISPEHITLEVTESLALLDVEHAADRLQELKQAGFRIAIDDFGTGYSSLSQLHEMQVDELKIDISFVRRLHEASGLSMAQAIINLAHALNLQTVAEGVETAEAAAKLLELGANHLQGYYFAKPMPVDELDRWLENQPHPGARLDIGAD
ncbi:MAG: EAL domain-containing protein [Sulfurimicrobium sp.]|nr:EAL domain-containing protein [Sulfurimicrobium sp.]